MLFFNAIKLHQACSTDKTAHLLRDFVKQQEVAGQPATLQAWAGTADLEQGIDACRFLAGEEYLVGPGRRILIRAALPAARRALPIFESRYPNDARPRKALEAAERLVDSTDDWSSAELIAHELEMRSVTIGITHDVNTFMIPGFYAHLALCKELDDAGFSAFLPKAREAYADHGPARDFDEAIAGYAAHHAASAIECAVGAVATRAPSPAFKYQNIRYVACAAINALRWAKSAAYTAQTGRAVEAQKQRADLMSAIASARALGADPDASHVHVAYAP